MKKLKTIQKVVLAMGIIGVSIGIFGRYQTWEYMEYFPFFYSGITMMWVAFLPQKKSCSNPFKRKAAQKS
ncbi:MAG TPA: hypothetical protein DEF18_05240 [Muricauda sp.]|uniref:DUF3098 domain-containing protein n=1 Tax=Flagellimonas abyssi TaxID=2864871 RepID=A0ABS7ER19_9FLAO|nr:hypothetical protein [Allomuricauda abyssi]MBC72418.1 hypothetical protein [Allomuricauda sp.]MBW8199991.1 hypothetical protein [Allomuricauda abyssi]HBU77487.1 hypothetical protein [Allomuricauda sp.]|tara:strand:+ start:4883 stop:5092 length:210 start_codon:yes stop_codon:yes gene_type:complete